SRRRSCPSLATISISRSSTSETPRWTSGARAHRGRGGGRRRGGSRRERRTRRHRRSPTRRRRSRCGGERERRSPNRVAVQHRVDHRQQREGISILILGAIGAARAQKFLAVAGSKGEAGDVHFPLGVFITEDIGERDPLPSIVLDDPYGARREDEERARPRGRVAIP